MWFPGYHGDVGGGNPRKQSGQSQYPLCWMIDEAAKCGLHFNTRTVNTVALGEPYSANSTYLYPEPSIQAPLHSSKRTAWAALEWLPKLTRYREDESRKGFVGLYIPKWEPRAIPENAHIHESTFQRKAKEGSIYDPKNLPNNYTTVPSLSGRFQNW